MANRFAVGTGTWDASNTAIWSDTSGGSTGFSVPTSSDDVVFDASTGVITLGATVNCGSYIATLHAGSFLLNGKTMNVGSASAGAFAFGASQTVTGLTLSVINLLSTSTNGGTGWPVTWAGKINVIVSVTFGALGGKWVLQDDISFTGNYNHVNGIMDFNNKNMTCAVFGSASSTPRTVLLGSSVITCTAASGTALQFYGGITYTIGTSQFILTGGAANAVYTGSPTLYALTMTGSQTTLSGACTYTNLTKTGVAALTDWLMPIGTQTVTGTLTLNGNSTKNRLLIQSQTVGTAVTISCSGTVTTTNTDFQDITATGVASWNLSAQGTGDCGGNTGITFTTPATQTWSGTTGTWSTNSWSSGRIPLPQDTAAFTSTFSASTVSVDMIRLPGIDFSGSTGTVTFNVNASVSFFGSVIFRTGVTGPSLGVGYTLAGRGAYVFDLNGGIWQTSLTLIAPNGTYSLASNFAALNTNTSLTFTRGTFNAGVYNLVNGGFSLNNSAATLNMGSGIWTCNTPNGFGFSVTGGTLNCQTSTIRFVNTTATTKTFGGGGKTFYNVVFQGATTITGSNTYNQLLISVGAARTILVTGATTQTVAELRVIVANGSLLTFQSTTASTWAITKTSGIVDIDRVSLKDSVASGGATFYAGANSTDATGNTGWTFAAAPIVARGMFLCRS